jgi:uncharacterized protein (TIGR00252 family)
MDDTTHRVKQRNFMKPPLQIGNLNFKVSKSKNNILLKVRNRHSLGKESEFRALEWFLKNKNAKLLTQNYRAKCGELDLIFEEVLPGKEIELVFVEVRATSADNWMDGPQSIDPWKQQHLKNTANHFLTRYRGPAQSMRLDLLTWDGFVWKHIPNLWI